MKNKIALVTGAATGIGEATALAFAREGCDLILATRKNAEGLKGTAEKIKAMGRKALTVMADVSKREDVERLCQTALKEFGRVDILMNNAGVGMSCELKDMSLEDWEWVMGVNFWGSVYTLHFLLPHMIERKSGHIVNVSSGAGLIGLPAAGAYTASKFGLVGLTEVLRTEVERFGIGVTAVCPAVVRTPIFDTIKVKGFKKEISTPPAIMGGMTPDQAASRIIKAVKRNQALLVITAFAKFCYNIKRLSPALGRAVCSGMFRELLKNKE
ncbi:MAG: SDR family NAD(P)-dependent oxidoreductase [bacterium]|nr:SDR family NAD(P)-dependent oxidoreductase [bacterium]